MQSFFVFLFAVDLMYLYIAIAKKNESNGGLRLLHMKDPIV